MTRSRLRLLFAASLLALAGCAGSAAEKIRTLDAQALKDYESNRPQEARKKLIEALAVAKDSGLESSPETSRARLYLGIVYVGALKQKDKGIEQMTLALQASPELKLPKSTAGKARVKKAYSTAKMKALMRQTGDEAVGEDAVAKDEGGKPADAVVAAPPPAPLPDRKAEAKPEKKLASREPVEAPKPPAEPADDEPDPPATLPTAVYCPLPDEVPPQQQVAVWCYVRNDVNARGVRLYFRPPGQEQFSLASMSKTKKGWFAGEIPATVVSGKTVQYYVEAVGSGDKVLAATGDYASPNLLLLRSGAKPVRKETLLVALAQKDEPAEKTASEEENPLATHDSADVDDGPGGTGGEAGRWFVAVGLGTGYGWHASGPLEFRYDVNADSGFGSTGFMHVLPEVGYGLGDHAVVSLQVRQQFISSQGSQDGRDGHPAPGAFSALLRYAYRFGDPSSALRPFVSGAVGGGEGVRVVLAPNKVDRQSGTDTVRGGPVVFGPGAGLRVRLASSLAWLVEARTLIGVPDAAVVFDADTGLQFVF